MGKSKKPVKKEWNNREYAALNGYRKMMHKQNGNQQGNQRRAAENRNQQGQYNSRMSFYHRAMEEYERKKAIKDEIRQAKETKRLEKEEALRKYAEKKRENFKKLSQKTKRGQPLMKGRMEILLEKLQKEVDSKKDAIK